MTHPSPADELRLLEERLLQPAFRRDRAAVAQLLADEFVEYGSSGRIFTKAQVLDLLAGEEPRRISLQDFAAQAIGPGVALATYRAIREADSGHGGTSLRSSLWIHREGRWQMIFHQGTPVSGL